MMSNRSWVLPEYFFGTFSDDDGRLSATDFNYNTNSISTDTIFLKSASFNGQVLLINSEVAE